MVNIELKTGDILNTHKPFVWWEIWRYLSVAIRLFEHIRYGKYSWSSHTAIVVVTDDGTFVYEADPTVKKTLIKDWCLDKEVSVTRIPENYFVNNNVTNSDIYKFCEAQLGEKYNFIGFLFYEPIYILTDKWIGKKYNGRVYCSQFVAEIIYKFFGLFKESYEIAPAKILEDTINYEIFRGKASDLL